MIYTLCLDKREEKGIIVEYKLKDFDGNIKVIKSEILKSLISEGELCVINLTLTSDNKLRVHSIPTLNDLFKEDKGEETQFNLNHALNDNRGLLGDIDTNNCYLYKHKLFFYGTNLGLSVLDINNKGITNINRVTRNSVHPKIHPKKIFYIQNGQYLNIFVECAAWKIDYPTYEILHIIFDVYNDNYTVKNIFTNIKEPNELLLDSYDLGVNAIVTLQDKSKNVLPYFILLNKKTFVCYNITAPSKDAMSEYSFRLKTAVKNGETFDVEVQPTFGVELSLGPYNISVEKKTNSGRLSKDI